MKTTDGAGLMDGGRAFVDAKGRRWAPHLTARVVWEYEMATGVHLFETVLGLAADQEEEADPEKAKLFAGVPEEMLRVALKLFGRPHDVAFLIHAGCQGKPLPPAKNLILVAPDSGLVVRSLAATAKGLRWLFSPSSRQGTVSLDSFGDSITDSRLMGEAMMVAYQAVLDFFPEMELKPTQEGGAQGPFSHGAG